MRSFQDNQVGLLFYSRPKNVMCLNRSNLHCGSKQYEVHRYFYLWYFCSHQWSLLLFSTMCTWMAEHWLVFSFCSVKWRLFSWWRAIHGGQGHRLLLLLSLLWRGKHLMYIITTNVFVLIVMCCMSLHIDLVLILVSFVNHWLAL